LLLVSRSRDAIRSRDPKVWMPPIFILSSFIELFVRGYGFFTPIMLLCYLGVFLSISKRRKLILT